jgi:probable F420-dependent oxidoreductase
MRIGLVLPSLGRGAGPAGLDAAAEATAGAGWHSLWVTDHLMVPRGNEEDEYGSILEAVTALTYVGARHPGVVLGTSVVVPAMRNAVLLAKELATLDVLSAGRLVVGVGVGDREDLPEFSNLGQADRFRVRGAYVDESIALWRHLWSGRTEPFEGRFHTLRDYVFRPLPVQAGGPPIWSGGRSEAAVRRAATLSDGYHASQTGPADLAERWPRIVELARSAGRPVPALSVRARVRFDAPAGPVYSIAGSADAMIGELLEFARLGVYELVVVFKATAPDDVRRLVERFDATVVRPFRDRMPAAAPPDRPA